MATQLMSPPNSASRTRHDPTPREIIASARAAPAPASGALWLGLGTSVLMWGSFTPLNCGPLGWLCLIPLLILVRLQRPTRLMYRMTYVSGLTFWLASLQWMRLGDPTMYYAWMALACYLAAYFPVFLALTRVAVHRLAVPMPLAVPVIWTGLEYLRAHLLTGFSWYYLGHTQYRWIELIQISDLFGAYGVSFLISAVAASAAELIPGSVLTRLKLLPGANRYDASLETPTLYRQVSAAGICLLLFTATLVYGVVRRGQAEFTAGPRIAAIQANFPTSLGNSGGDAGEIYTRHEMLTRRAVPLQPDIIVWPETMFPNPLFEAPPEMTAAELQRAVPYVPSARWRDPMVAAALNDLSQKAGAALVIGIQTITAAQDGAKIYNSAAFITPDAGLSGRYDKMHRVPFGEYLPYQDVLPFLGKLSPYRGDFGIQAGKQPVAFEYKGFRLAPIICFEDTVPHVVRNVVQSLAKADPSHRGPDVLLNLSNDGWFHGSSELDQHLITAAFRSVECRTPMIRAVNTGVSALIDGDGMIRARAVDPDTKRSKEVDAILVETVPLDRRSSWYVAAGDWFAQLCLGGCGLCVVCGLLRKLPYFARRTDPEVR